MKSKLFRRTTALLLAFLMVFSLVPSSVFAKDSTNDAGDVLGQVRVIVENTTYPKSEGAAWDGTLVDTNVNITASSTMMTCVVDALGSYSQTGAEDCFWTSR